MIVTFLGAEHIYIFSFFIIFLNFLFIIESITDTLFFPNWPPSPNSPYLENIFFESI